TFLFTYATTVTGLAPGKAARVWVPVPPSNDEQSVRVESEKLPGKGKIHYDPRNDNHYLHVEAKAGEDGTIELVMVYRVTRRELRGLTETFRVSEDRVKRFLEPDSVVPVGGKPLELLMGKTLPDDPMARARVLYDVVNNHMKYDKSRPGWGKGDAVWACESGYGNCSDFHSLFISLARASK